MHSPTTRGRTPVTMLILSLLFMLVFPAAVTQAQEYIAPEAAAGETYYAAFPLIVTVDGNLAEWAAVPYSTFNDGPQRSSNPAQDGSVAFAAVADSENLYLSLLVTDSTIIAGQNGIQYWSEDSVEVYINASGNLDRTSFGPGVAQINFPAVNIGKPIEQAIFAGLNWEITGVEAVTVATETGYAIEASIPLDNGVWSIVPAEGETIGFQVQLNGASQAGGRAVKLSWSNKDKSSDQSYTNPSVFGRLTFSEIEGADSMPVAAVAAAATPVASATPVEVADASAQNGAFRVDGSTIYTPNGQPFVARGVNVSGFNWVWDRPTMPDIDQITSCWAFNLVRVNNFLFTNEQPWPHSSVNNNVDEIIQAFTARGIVVVMEAHDRIGSYYQGDHLTTLVNWFTDLAARYRDNPYVWFDVSNEPGGRGGVDAENWLNMHRQVIRAIRDTAGNNNIIIVEGANGGQDAGDNSSGNVAQGASAILSYGNDVMTFDGKTYPNIVFSIHPYDQWNGGDARMADFLDRVRAQNFALIIGEYGVRTDQDVQPATQTIFNTAPPRNVGLIVWHWVGGDDNDLTANTSTGGGWEINDCNNPTNLSWLGQLVWNHNRAS